MASRTLVRALVLGMLIAMLLVPSSSWGACPELIENGELASEQTPWTVESNPPTPLLNVSFFQGMRVSIPDPEFNIYTVEISQPVRIHKGSGYRFSFFVDSPPAAQVHLAVANAANPSHAYGLDRELTQADGSFGTASTYANYEGTFVATATDPSAKLVISFSNDPAYNPFIRLTGVSLVQTSGVCYDGSPEAGPHLDGSAERSPVSPDDSPAPPDGSPTAPDSAPLLPRLAAGRGCVCSAGHATGNPQGPPLLLMILLLAQTVRHRR